MRCINCGWNNPDTAVVCQKCKQPLPVIPGVMPVTATTRMKIDTEAKKTTREPEAVAVSEPIPEVATVPEPVPVQEPAPVPEPIPEPVLGPEPESVSEQVTVSELASAMKLMPLEAGEPIVFEVLPGIVNRNSGSNLGAAVDAVCQAEISCAEEGWYIEDKSANKSTYVLASRKIRVEKGDIVILGGRRYVIE